MRLHVFLGLLPAVYGFMDPRVCALLKEDAFSNGLCGFSRGSAETKQPWMVGQNMPVLRNTFVKGGAVQNCSALFGALRDNCLSLLLRAGTLPLMPHVLDTGGLRRLNYSYAYPNKEGAVGSGAVWSGKRDVCSPGGVGGSRVYVVDGRDVCSEDLLHKEGGGGRESGEKTKTSRLHLPGAGSNEASEDAGEAKEEMGGVHGAAARKIVITIGSTDKDGNTTNDIVSKVLLTSESTQKGPVVHATTLTSSSTPYAPIMSSSSSSPAPTHVSIPVPVSTPLGVPLNNNNASNTIGNAIENGIGNTIGNTIGTTSGSPSGTMPGVAPYLGSTHAPLLQNGLSTLNGNVVGNGVGNVVGAPSAVPEDPRARVLSQSAPIPAPVPAFSNTPNGGLSLSLNTSPTLQGTPALSSLPASAPPSLPALYDAPSTLPSTPSILPSTTPSDASLTQKIKDVVQGMYKEPPRRIQRRRVRRGVLPPRYVDEDPVEEEIMEESSFSTGEDPAESPSSPRPYKTHSRPRYLPAYDQDPEEYPPEYSPSYSPPSRERRRPRPKMPHGRMLHRLENAISNLERQIDHPHYNNTGITISPSSASAPPPPENSYIDITSDIPIQQERRKPYSTSMKKGNVLYIKASNLLDRS
ncbi:hypothetical protein NECID01_1832 [Nematocida sp. AWRm77]|nr:hypothetical protein NECID01_1832 [Nematocida sp. AWRm77]